MQEESTTEEWRTIPGYEGVYSASSQGRIRRDLGWRGRIGQIQRPGLRQGYPRLILSKEKRRQSHCVHNLVALTFLGPAPLGTVVNHIDGNKEHNAATNLEYLTPAENTLHAYRIGLSSRPRESWRKIQEPTRNDIRNTYAAGGVSMPQIARRYGVAYSTIWRIIHNWQR